MAEPMPTTQDRPCADRTEQNPTERASPRTEAQDGLVSVRVRVPEAVAGRAIEIVTVTITATCPTCGGPRGTPTARERTRRGVTYEVDEWVNPCGHVDFYNKVLSEAFSSPGLHGDYSGSRSR